MKAIVTFFIGFVVGFVIGCVIGCVIFCTFGVYPVGTNVVYVDGSNSESFAVTHKKGEVPGWEIGKSLNLSDYIHPDHQTTILSPKNLCSRNLDLLIIVISSTRHFVSRMNVRQNWANKTNLQSLNVGVAFILGQSKNVTISLAIAEESYLYDDIIQEEFLDTYNNLTLKTMMALKWTISNCHNLKYLMKADDDTIVNVTMVLDAIKTSHNPDVGLLMGTVLIKPYPIRDMEIKGSLPMYMYPEDTMPEFCLGFAGYVMSMDVANKLYQTALMTPLVHMEDMFITGIVAKRANITLQNHPSLATLLSPLNQKVLQTVMTWNNHDFRTYDSENI